MRNAIYLAAVVLAIGTGAHFSFQLDRAGSPWFFSWIAIPTVILAALGAAIGHSEGVLKEWLRVKTGDFSRGFAGTAILFAMAWGAARMVAPSGTPRDSWLARFYLQLGTPTMLRQKVSYVVLAIVVMAVTEEIVWRGFVTSRLETLVGSRRAWIAAAFLYALSHVPTIWALRDPVAGPNPLVVLAALGAGLVWGFMARRFGRLWPGIFSHILFDWAVLMMFRLWGPSV